MAKMIQNSQKINFQHWALGSCTLCRSLSIVQFSLCFVFADRGLRVYVHTHRNILTTINIIVQCVNRLSIYMYNFFFSCWECSYLLNENVYFCLLHMCYGCSNRNSLMCFNIFFLQFLAKTTRANIRVI